MSVHLPMVLRFLLLFSLAIAWQTCAAQLVVNQVWKLPQKVSNNAVCEGFVNGVPHLYSFTGIDSTKQHEGIHLKTFCVNLETGQSQVLENVPDTMGKVACGASRIDSIIYIVGGYHVFASGTELSSRKVHRFNVNTSSFISDAADLKIATDDHMQAVWRDSLLYVITGWNNTRNIPNVQVYNPASDEWILGTPVPNLDSYKSFGASGVIIKDTIFYYGGAASVPGFPIQYNLRKGVIDPNNASRITWSDVSMDMETVGYRMAATVVNGVSHWIGGSAVTYNYDGIAYDGSGGVDPLNRDLYFVPGDTFWTKTYVDQLPMDLRGIAKASETKQFVAGGMLGDQQVTDLVYELSWDENTVGHRVAKRQNQVCAWPNPAQHHLRLGPSMFSGQQLNYRVFNVYGMSVLSGKCSAQNPVISIVGLQPGNYVLVLDSEHYYRFLKR